MAMLNAATEVEDRPRPTSQPPAGSSGGDVILNATGYIVAAHKIQVASKVLGRVAWIGVEKGDKVGKARSSSVSKTKSTSATRSRPGPARKPWKRRLKELETGSRPEEIDARESRSGRSASRTSRTRKINLDRTRAGPPRASSQSRRWMTRRRATIAKWRAMNASAKVVRAGPHRSAPGTDRRRSRPDRGSPRLGSLLPDPTRQHRHRAPVTGTILERAVEKGEFVTTSFVGERGAKGYVVSLADLNDLASRTRHQPERFRQARTQAEGHRHHRRIPGSQVRGRHHEISPEANRQKATVQVKVKIREPGRLSAPRDERKRCVHRRERQKPGTPQAALSTSRHPPSKTTQSS